MHDEHWRRIDWPGSPSGYLERAGEPTPCQACPKCRDSEEKTPQAGQRAELSLKNLRALEFYLGTRGGRLRKREKRDPLVRKCAAILEWTFELHRSVQQSAAIEAIGDMGAKHGSR
jgi:hypothetical protein